ncbi:MAG: hypothetical protein QXJ59_07795, partial [Thermofilaceae archaeon]
AIQMLEKPHEARGSVPANQSSQPNPHTSLSKLREASSGKFYTLLSDTLKSREPESLLRLALLARLSEASALAPLAPRTPKAISPAKVTVCDR